MYKSCVQGLFILRFNQKIISLISSPFSSPLFPSPLFSLIFLVALSLIIFTPLLHSPLLCSSFPPLL